MPANHIVTSCAGAADNLRKKEEFTLLARFKARSIFTAGTVAQTVVRHPECPAHHRYCGPKMTQSCALCWSFHNYATPEGHHRGDGRRRCASFGCMPMSRFVSSYTAPARQSSCRWYSPQTHPGSPLAAPTPVPQVTLWAGRLLSFCEA